MANFLELRGLAPDLPFIPVLQGWTMGDYDRCAEMYVRAGVNLADQRAVGLGSVCRRQNTIRIGLIVALFAGLRLHGFGVKTTGLAAFGSQLTSADSMAWSLDARRPGPLPGQAHGSCANCLDYAAQWRADLLERLPQAA